MKFVDFLPLKPWSATVYFSLTGILLFMEAENRVLPDFFLDYWNP